MASWREKQGQEIEATRKEALEEKNRKKTEMYVIEPGDSYYEGILIPARFREVVLSHVVAMYLQNNTHYLPPVFLAIEGKAGEGKTVQAIASCVQFGITVYYISASELSGSHEGEADRKLKSIYSQAVSMRQGGEKNVILIDDFHMGIATVDNNVRKTINSSLLTGYMMNICQKSEDEKVPVILTGNDFSNVYAPLLRSGRAERFYWEPGYEEKKRLVQNLFADVLTDENGLFDEFYDRCSCASMADFAQLRNDYRKGLVIEQLNQYKKLDDNTAKRISHYVEENIQHLNINILTQLAKTRGIFREEMIDGHGT